MIADEYTTFATAATVPTAAGDSLVGDVIDLADQPLTHTDLYLIIKTDTAVAGGTSIQFDLMSDSDAAIDPASGTLHYSTGAVAVAQLTANTFVARVMLPIMDAERYLGIVVRRVGVGSAGTFSAFLSPSPAAWAAYPEGQN